ncbi:hypothetical protein GH5_02751 [Leishmania sp. Ghana 2012 LV757]|uniref:hypothetical protein n=1 Tax=Leishmania sp. Ghana 2012 LV757 TaxID=2803181 RepID=UPI001B506C22|nr:hypothetical protein GH5_02751 [Leishmania sp. Ghana 2012 LV757]
MTSTSTPCCLPPVPAALPETDEARLMFYAEVLMANVPSLIADLSSAKYAFLSFSEKTRNEVKQKSTLIQSISRTFISLQNAKQSLNAAQHTLQEYETKLVRASPPAFVTSAEALHLSNARVKGGGPSADENGSVSPSYSEAVATAPRRLVAASPDNLFILNEEDIRPVREAEEAHEKETAAYAGIAKACNTMEDALEKAQDQCRVMTEHVQGLKWEYDEVYNSWKCAERERQIVRVMRDELKDRRAIMTEACQGLKVIEDKCLAQESEIIEDFMAHAHAEEELIRAELQAKRSRNELELVAYQIAYKEQQAEVESLRERCKLLRAHQRDLEVLAKKQQLEETDRNCLRKLVMETLMLTPSKHGKAEDRELTAEQQGQVRNDHLLVSLLAARISVLEEQRKTVGGLLVNARGVGKSGDVSATIDRIRTLLEAEVQLDGDALKGE